MLFVSLNWLLGRFSCDVRLVYVCCHAIGCILCENHQNTIQFGNLRSLVKQNVNFFENLLNQTKNLEEKNLSQLIT